MYRNLIKPLFDFLFSFLALLVLSPIFLVVWIGLFIANNGKPFFFQKRPGKDERIFTIIKFRTMNEKKDENGNLLADPQRLTAIGKFVRSSSLDELPQLWNVLFGDMSFIGPRPLLPEYLPLYNDFQKQRHHVKPGITGWAQLNYPYGSSTEDAKYKLEFDLYYVKNQSLFLDFLILLQTVEVILFGKGAR